MKIAFYIPVLNVGGAEKVIINLLKELSKTHICYLITDNMESLWISKIDSRIEIINLSSHFNFIKRLKTLNKIIKKNAFDVVVSHLTHSNIHCLLIKLIRKYNLIVVEHSITSQYLDGLTKLNSLTKKAMVKMLFNFANLIVCVSETAKKDLVNKFQIKKENCLVIYNPLDFNEINTLAIESLDNTFESKINNRRILVTVGRLEKLKNHYFLIDSIKEMLRELNLCLLIIGDGDQKERLQQKINKESLNNYVYMLGFEDNPYKYISKSSILIHPSKFEGFGLTLIEGIYLKTEVISMNFEASFEILENGKLGEIISDKESLLNSANKVLLANNDKKQVYSDYVKFKYNLEFVSRQYVNAFKKVASG